MGWGGGGAVRRKQAETETTEPLKDEKRKGMVQLLGGGEGEGVGAQGGRLTI